MSPDGRRPQSQGEIRSQGTGNPDLARKLDDILDPDLVKQSDRRQIVRMGQCIPQADHPVKSLSIVLRLPRLLLFDLLIDNRRIEHD